MGPTMVKCCDASSNYRISLNDIKTNHSTRTILDSPSSKIKYETEKKQLTDLSELPITKKNLIPNIKGSPYNIYTEIKTVGEGAYGKVIKVKHKTTGQIRAIKIISKKSINEFYTLDEIENEIQVLKNLAHPNIIKLFEVFSDYKNYYLVNEFCTEGELLKYIQKFKQFPEKIVEKIMFRIFTAISYLHFNGVIHGDIKLENIMIDSAFFNENSAETKNTTSDNSDNNSENNISEHDIKSNTKKTLDCLDNLNEHNDNNSKCIHRKPSFDSSSSSISFEESFSVLLKGNNDDQKLEHNDITDDEYSEKEKTLTKLLLNFDVKLIDFGCSKLFNPKSKFFNDRPGTINYSAPEVIRQNYNEKSDIWSCGVLMYILLSGELPFQGVTELEISNKILRGRYCFVNRKFKDISFEAKDLIRKCLEYNPSKRISAKNALNHPFFKKEIKILRNNVLNLCTHFEDKLKEVFDSLIEFSQKTKFYQAVLSFLTHNFISKESSVIVKNIFLSIDTDMDGKLSCNELIQAFKKMNLQISDEEVSNIMSRVDFDKDGMIDYSEFLQATTNVKKLFTDENLKYAFNLFDTQSDGTISVKELEETLGLDDCSNSIVINELLKEINKTENDEFTFDEFKMMMREFSDYNSKFDIKKF